MWFYVGIGVLIVAAAVAGYLGGKAQVFAKAKVVEVENGIIGLVEKLKAKT